MAGEDGDVGIFGDGAQQGALDLAAGGVLGMEHAAAGVAALAGEVEFVRAGAVNVVALVEVDAQGDEFADARGSLADDDAHGGLVAEARPGFERVLDVQLEGILVAPHAGHAALRPGGAAVGGSALGDDGHPPLRGGLEREGQTGHAAADDDEIVVLHGEGGSGGTAAGGFDHDVIDQARAAEEHGEREQGGFFDGADGLQVFRVHDLGVIDARQGGRGQFGVQNGAQGVGVAFAGSRAGGGEQERAAQDGGLGAFVGGEVDVARTEREAVGSRTVSAGRISRGKFRSRTMRRMMASCWKSFWPNTAAFGRTRLNNFATTVHTPTEMPRPRSAAQAAGEQRFVHRDRRARGVHARRVRVEHDVHAAFPAPREVGAQRARVFGEVFLRPKLQRVDENAHHHPPFLPHRPAGVIDEREVSRDAARPWSAPGRRAGPRLAASRAIAAGVRTIFMDNTNLHRPPGLSTLHIFLPVVGQALPPAA